MALSGNFRKKLGDLDKAPVLKQSVRHGDVIHLAGGRVPSRFSRRKIEAMKRAGYID